MVAPVGSHYTITSGCLLVGRKVNRPIARSYSLISPQVFQSYDCQTKFNPSLGMDNEDELYGCSAVKVKLVDSFDLKTIHSQLNSYVEATTGSDKLYVPLSRGHQKVSSGH